MTTSLKRRGARRFVRVGAMASAVFFACLPIAHADDITYGYDVLGRLTSVTVSGATAWYDYDAAGNIIAIRRSGVAARQADLPSDNAGGDLKT